MKKKLYQQHCTLDVFVPSGALLSSPIHNEQHKKIVVVIIHKQQASKLGQNNKNSKKWNQMKIFVQSAKVPFKAGCKHIKILRDGNYESSCGWCTCTRAQGPQ